MTLKPTLKLIIVFVLLIACVGCAFNFELTSQRTALENQILGSYKEIEDDVVLASSVRGVDASGNRRTTPDLSEMQEKALRAKQNQDFNRDDLDELKVDQLLGERADGTLGILPEGVGGFASANPAKKRLAEVLIAEENKDRQTIWHRTVQSNENLSEKDMPEVRKTFAKIARDASPAGTWIQDETGNWLQKR